MSVSAPRGIFSLQKNLVFLALTRVDFPTPWGSRPRQGERNELFRHTSAQASPRPIPMLYTLCRVRFFAVLRMTDLCSPIKIYMIFQTADTVRKNSAPPNARHCFCIYDCVSLKKAIRVISARDKALCPRADVFFLLRLEKFIVE